ncbi:enoyl-CoA hydratase/carnithine racemase [Actinoplanes campanulatus]|uniref:Enoyl-CoA hydratase/carnithine racemase n=1 Tax=Actinoplanes campanulatus TaxID=113559 RepID=A0A7W5AE16_9ACTN|nr:crotonase/enoyl-CoA hydratase family protein [Actinoplanes campanulatus]MBB3094234.1 enoyl-CoA hydratase/carnithine racemase [Actinoplanes campanulatus]GGN42993.1 enoyl-CoA hydratase/isomerase family protein [Actinoplanes campanulatus]GID35846.1 enoyl-CoA hydratase/isomerase family protein [Actinoplanes campanulatus]
MKYVSVSVENGIAQVRLNRPDKLNALALDTLDELITVARRLRKDRTLRAVVIAGEGASFCSGLDIAAAMRTPGRIVRAFIPAPWRGTNRFQEACWAWRRIPVPVIAAVHGHCYGGGVQIALAADFRYATPDSKWSVLEGKWGIIPDMSGIRSLTEVTGPDVAKRLTMTAETISGSEAQRLGLVTELADDPVKAATAFAESLLTRSPDALAAAKRLVDGALTSSARRTFARERRAQIRLLALPNTKILRKAVMAKSTPDFQPRSRP